MCQIARRGRFERTMRFSESVQLIMPQALLRSSEFYFSFWYEQDIYFTKLLYVDEQELWEIFPYPKSWILI